MIPMEWTIQVHAMGCGPSSSERAVKVSFMDQTPTFATEASDPKFPEIVLGLVAPYGTPLTFFTTTLQGALKSRCAYNSEVLHLSAYTKMFTGLSQPYPATGVSEAERVGAAILTDRGDVISVGTNEVPRAGGG